ncbi:kinase-like domain-containing protein [Xylariaceae sp. FL1019]|nr:kinase-like domain-containing protein [Xylariaceae sp. FL1019]
MKELYIHVLFLSILCMSLFQSTSCLSMPLDPLPRLGRVTYRRSIRMASTFKCISGCVYVQGEALQRRQNPELSIFKAESGNESFVFKRVSESIFDLSLRLAAEFAGSRRLRMHIDCNQEQGILVYPFFRTTLLALLQDYPDFPPQERRKILRRVGEGIQELHSKNWIHLDVKPDNIFVDWTCDEDGNKTVTNAVLGDFDISFKPEGDTPLQTPYPLGNAMWRSPEGQTGRGVTKASDIFSFGLAVIYTFGGGEHLILDAHEYQELVKSGITAEQEIVSRHFVYFGPEVPEGLLKLVDSEDWCLALKNASEQAKRALKDRPDLGFQRWGQQLSHETVSMISGLINLDPAARLTIDQFLKHPWWEAE